MSKNSGKPYAGANVKIGLIGLPRVGKSILLERFLDQWRKQCEKGGDAAKRDLREIRVDDLRTDFRFEVVDINNNGDLTQLEQAIKPCQGIIFVYSLADKDSIGPNLDKLADALCRAKDVKSTADFPCLLFGNKLDARKAPNAVGQFIIMVEGLNKAKSMGAKFFEGSALTGEKVDEAFIEVAKSVMERRRKHPESNEGGKGANKDEKEKCVMM